MELKEAIEFLENALSDKKEIESLSGEKSSWYDLYFRGKPKLEEAVRELLKNVKN